MSPGAAALLFIAAGALVQGLPPAPMPTLPYPGPALSPPLPSLPALGPSSAAPVAPPTSNAVPNLAAPPTRISPLLLSPGPMIETPTQVAPVYPSLQIPSRLDRQQIEAYRRQLVIRRQALERQGVSPTSEPYREIQQELQRLNAGTRR